MIDYNPIITVQYEFKVDLNITKDQIPFVKTDLLIDIPESESIECFPIESRRQWYDVYILYGNLEYGDNNIIAICPAFKKDYYWYSNKLWRFKYSRLKNESYYVPQWTGTSNTYFGNDIYWKNLDTYEITSTLSDGTEKILNMPYAYGNFIDYPELPYKQIIIRRNKAVSLNYVENINPVYDVPSNYSFPDMELHYGESMAALLNQNKYWIKISENKYRLVVVGEFKKKTQKASITYNYNTYEDFYVPHHYKYYVGDPVNDWEYLSCYKLLGKTHHTSTKKIYSSQQTSSKVKLVVGYINKNNKYELKEIRNEI